MLPRTGGALDRTGGQKIRTGGTLQRTAGAICKTGVLDMTDYIADDWWPVLFELIG